MIENHKSILFFKNFEIPCLLINIPRTMTNNYPIWFFIKLTVLTFFISTNLNYAQTNCNVSNGVITVTNTLDQGAGSLREAITCANLIPGPNLINFNIPGTGSHVIFVGSLTGIPLPTVTDASTFIDATSQPGFGNGTEVVLDGSQNTWTGPFDAILIQNANFCAVLGLTVRFFPDDAIDVTNSDGCTVAQNVVYSNGSTQNVFPGFPGLWFGCGIVVKDGSDNCTVQGNTVGTNQSQTIVAGNEFCGIVVLGFCLGAQIEGNIVANNPEGIRIDNSFNCTIRFNEVYCNTQGTVFINNGNNNKLPPAIVTATTTLISGTGPTGDMIDVYLMDDSCSGVACQGRVYLGTTSTSLGAWSLIGPFANGFIPSPGMRVTAVSTSPNGMSSTFSSCSALIPGSATNSCADANGDIFVTNTNDSGQGSLRAAIDCANAVQGPNQIVFNIPSNGPHQIFVGSGTGLELPPLLDAGTVLDATTQPGFGINGNFAPQIILNGNQNNWQAPINALFVIGNFCEVYGF